MKNKNSLCEISDSSGSAHSEISLGKKTNIKKKFFRKALPTLVLVALFCFISVENALACREGVVINEIYGGGGNSGSFYKNDFVELYNNSKEDIGLEGWTLGYASSLSSLYLKMSLSGIIFSERSLLIGAGGGNGGEEKIPVSDFIFNSNFSATAGKIYLWNEKDEIVDMVGYGNASSFEGLAAAFSPGNTKSISRKNNCDSDDNSKDFEKIDPTPRNSIFEEDEIEEHEDSDEEILPCEESIILNEIHPYTEEFVEVYNSGEEACLFESWSVSDSLGSENSLNHKKFFEKNIIIEAEGFTVVSGNLFLNDDGDSVKLFNSKGKKIEEVVYLKNEKQKSLSRFENEWKWTPFVTKGLENREEIEDEIEENEEDFEERKKIFINEILPNPKRDESKNEWIEIFNSSDDNINLKNWTIKDSSKSGKFVFKDDLIVESEDFLVIYRKESKIALNNSGGEEVFLINPKNKVVSRVSYSQSAKEDISYAFDGEKWRWTKSITPGKKNVFGKIPKIEVASPKEAYLDVYAEFEVKINYKNKKDTKVVWDFGDGHKSYKQKTRHKYDKKGEYKASVKVSNGVEDVIENFKVKVEKLPHPKMKIVSVSPNPVGKDSELETITIKNDSKKKVNLLGWSLATGWKKLINHPIRESFEIKPGKEKVLTREYSAFSLNNKKQKIELRYPDGKVAYEMKYKSEKSIEEGMVYKKEKGKKWEWKKSNQESGIRNQENAEVISQQSFVIENQIKAEDIGKRSEKEQEDVFEEAEKFASIAFPKNDLSKPLVLGANALWVDEGGFYRFMYESPEGEHYAIKFIRNFSNNINVYINSILNRV